MKTPIDPKKRAAAVSAVLSYLMQETAVPQTVQPPPAPVAPNAWGQSGRQNSMHLRQLMQLRALRGSQAM